MPVSTKRHLPHHRRRWRRVRVRMYQRPLTRRRSRLPRTYVKDDQWTLAA